jgi:hypothetical protein
VSYDYNNALDLAGQLKAVLLRLGAEARAEVLGRLADGKQKAPGESARELVKRLQDDLLQGK